ncbi:MAG TPA: cupin domain-containing protein [Blastocatellia bacterium]|nr:cupin domain-containing protein [Blastocatellia bacterium]
MDKELKEPVVINFTDDKFSKEVVPGVAYMKHTFGNELSVALFKIAKGQGGKFPKTFHSHGEEIGIQLKGSAKVWACGKEYTINEGEAIIIPGGLEHAGIFGEEEGLLLAIATPPRKDYGPADW